MAKIKVYGKAQNRIALGIIHAYMVMHPKTTLMELRNTFPNSLNPDSGVKENFIYAEEKGTTANWDGYFKADMEELVAYKRKEKCDENNCVHDTNTGVLKTNTYKFVDFFTDEEIVVDYGEDFDETVFIGPLNNEEWALAKKNVIEDFYASCKKYYGLDVENIEFTDQEFTDFFNRYKECMEEGEDIEEVECKGLIGSVFQTMAESIAKLYFYDCIGEIHFDYGYGMIDFTFELDLDNEECLEGYC